MVLFIYVPVSFQAQVVVTLQQPYEAGWAKKQWLVYGHSVSFMDNLQVMWLCFQFYWISEPGIYAFFLFHLDMIPM